MRRESTPENSHRLARQHLERAIILKRFSLTERKSVMTYIEGFVAAVPTANKEKYREHAKSAAALFKEFGVARMVETWGDDIPKGKLNDLRGAVKAKDDEDIILQLV